MDYVGGAWRASPTRKEHVDEQERHQEPAHRSGARNPRDREAQDEVHSNQLFTAHTAELLEGGDYTLWVESRGGDAEGPLQRDSCKVKYLRVVDPEPTFTKVCGTGHEDDPAWTNKVARNGKLSIVGANLTDDLVVSLLYAGEYETGFDVDEVTPTMITGTIADGVEPGSSYSFTLKKADGTVIGTATITNDA